MKEILWVNPFWGKGASLFPFLGGKRRLVTAFYSNYIKNICCIICTFEIQTQKTRMFITLKILIKCIELYSGLNLKGCKITQKIKWEARIFQSMVVYWVKITNISTEKVVTKNLWKYHFAFTVRDGKIMHLQETVVRLHPIRSILKHLRSYVSRSLRL